MARRFYIEILLTVDAPTPEEAERVGRRTLDIARMYGALQESALVQTTEDLTYRSDVQ